MPQKPLNWDESEHPRDATGEFADKQKTDEPRPKTERDYSDQEKAIREESRTAEEVMSANPADFKKFSTRDLTLARGHLLHQVRVTNRKLTKGDITKEQHAGLVDSYNREADYIGSVIADHVNGRSIPPDDMSRSEKIAEKAYLENRSMTTVAKEMGLTTDEFRDIRQEVEDDLKNRREMESIEKYPPPSEARKRAMKSQQQRQAKEDQVAMSHASPPRQSLVFDTNSTARLFEGAILESSNKNKKKPVKSPPQASLLEKIEDDLKKMHDESRPIGGQKEFFSRMRDAIDRYASKPSHLNQKSSQRQDQSSNNKKGKWVTVNGTHVFIVGGKIVKGPSQIAQKSDVNQKDQRRTERSTSLAGSWVVEKDPIWKNVKIPSVRFKEWIEGDEPEVKIPKSKRGRMIYDSAKQAAESSELPLQDVLRLMPEAHKYLKQEQQSREQAKAELRRVSGLTAGSIARMENKYLDHSTLKGWDTTSREFAMNHPDLGFDPESHSLPALLWDFIREGKLPYIPSFDPKVAELAAEWARPKRLAKNERLPGDEEESHSHVESRSGDAVPFSRRAMLVEKFSRAFLLSPHDLLQSQIRRAASETDVNPSEEQRQAGNYRKGKFRWNGLEIAIEYPAGSVRSGTGDGTSWSIEMKNHYGYILKNVSEADGDHVDVFVGPNPESDLVCVVDQNKKDGRFDEHKVMIGFVSADEAESAYRSNYSEDWTGFGSITAMTVDQFLEWLSKGDTGKVVSRQVSRYSRDVIARKFSRIFQKHKNLPLRQF